MGIDVKDEGGDPQKRAEQKEMDRFMLLASKYLDEEGDDSADPGKAMISELVNEEPPIKEAPMEEEVTQEEPMGLMARG
jgi:hypothetical protein